MSSAAWLGLGLGLGLLALTLNLALTLTLTLALALALTSGVAAEGAISASCASRAGGDGMKVAGGGARSPAHSEACSAAGIGGANSARAAS